MRLTDLIVASGASAPLAGTGSDADAIEITSLAADSRTVVPGALFAALPGSRATGSDFIAEAVNKGARAVLVPAGTPLPVDIAGLAVISDPEPRLRLARMAAAFHSGQPEGIVAVTGTSGKSSTVSFARQIWQRNGYQAASLGTLGIESDHLNRYGSLTTAGPIELHADLAALAQSGVTRVAMEASSHGLDQYRLDGVRLRAAGFTTFGRDHLDYHRTIEAYLDAKLRLFSEVLPPKGLAVLNADIPEFATIAAAARDGGRSVISYGTQGAALRILERVATPTGQSVRLAAAGREWSFDLPLVGAFQLMNALCAVGLVIGSECSDALMADPRAGDFLDSLRWLKGVRGRLEHVASLPNGAAVYVDYAHKPDALVAVLQALRPHTAGRLVVAFGCGGDRDPGKRPLMGEIAARLADTVIVTDDNPRSEDPAAIRATIMAAAPGAIEIGDREDAIRSGIRTLGPGDVFVVAGKGHEQGQIVGDTVRPFDDADIVRHVVAGLV